MTHSELIEALGGGTKVADRLSEMVGEPIDREAVYQWRIRDVIPYRWRPFLAGIAQQEGIKLPKGFMPKVGA